MDEFCKNRVCFNALHGRVVWLLASLVILTPFQFKNKIVFFRSPSGINSFYSWPSYKSPDWTYLNLTAGTIGLTGQKSMRSKCTFWNSILKPFISDLFDERGGHSIGTLKRCNLNELWCSYHALAVFINVMLQEYDCLIQRYKIVRNKYKMKKIILSLF